MKNPINQNQHKLPQVYMRQFGYLFNNQWKVSVIKIGEKFTRRKSIESFLSKTDIFKIKDSYEDLENIFEGLNGMIENEYLNLVNDLENQNKFSEKSRFILLQLIPNLLCRTDLFRDLVKEIINSDSKVNFLRMICVENYKNIEELESQKYFQVMINETTSEGLINKILIFLSRYLQLRLLNYEIVILKSQDEKTWSTSDNPVIFEYKYAKFDFLTDDSEIYFPLNPKYLIYLHNYKSSDKSNNLRLRETNEVYEVNDEENIELQQKILLNAIEYVIVDGEFNYKIE